MRVLAIDPGNTHTGYAVIDTADCRPLEVGKILNGDLLTALEGLSKPDSPILYCPIVAIEMIASYGMPVGAEVFETCVWIGRFQQAIIGQGIPGTTVDLVLRRDVKLHLCHTSKAKDANIIQALVDRFAHGQPNRGKGTRAEPGWFHGFAADMWQAYALAVTIADQKEGRLP